MKIALRNGESIELQWNPIILEYLEDYEGGLEQLKKDVEIHGKQFRAFNFIIYCVMNASYSRELSYTEAVSLVDINDIEKIVDFITENTRKVKTEKIDNVVRKHRR